MIAYKATLLSHATTYNYLASLCVIPLAFEKTYEIGRETRGVWGPMFFFDSMYALRNAVAYGPDSGVVILVCEIDEIVPTPRRVPHSTSTNLFEKFWDLHERGKLNSFSGVLVPVAKGTLVAWVCTPIRIIEPHEIEDILEMERKNDSI